jgi:hypothetical protein
MPPVLVGLADVRAATDAADGHAGAASVGREGAPARLATVAWAVGAGNGKCVAVDAASRRALLPSDRHAAAVACCVAKPLAAKHLAALGDLVAEQRAAAGLPPRGAASARGAAAGLGGGWSARAVLQCLIQGGADGRRGSLVPGCADLATLADAQARAVANLRARQRRGGVGAGGSAAAAGANRSGELALALGFTLPSEEASWRGTKLDRSGLLAAGGAT